MFTHPIKPKFSAKTRVLLGLDMPAVPDAKTRLRQRIARLLEDRGKTQRALAVHLGHGDQWASNLMSGRHALAWTDLDRVAQFLRVPPSELVRLSDDPWELTPTEMRVVRAMRMLPPPVRDHFATMIDYTVGSTPDEIQLLTRLRELTPENLDVVEHWIDLKRFEQAHGQTGEGRAEPPETIPSPDGRSRRIRGAKGR